MSCFGTSIGSVSNFGNRFVDFLLLGHEIMFYAVVVKHLLTLKNISHLFQSTHLTYLILDALLLAFQVKNTFMKFNPRIMESVTQPPPMSGQSRLRFSVSQGFKSKRVEVLCFVFEPVFDGVFNGAGVSLEAIVNILLPFMTLTQYSGDVLGSSHGTIVIPAIFEHPGGSLDLNWVFGWTKTLIFLFHNSITIFNSICHRSFFLNKLEESHR